MIRELLIDADCLVYLFAYRNQTNVKFRLDGDGQEVITQIAHVDTAIIGLNEFIEELKTKLDATNVFMALSDTEENFRRALLSSYKAGRKDSERPVLYYELREYILGRRDWHPKVKQGWEGDDVLGCWLSDSVYQEDGVEAICCSIDKDMRTIPGNHYNWDKPDDGVYYVSHDEANYFFYTQILTGDRVDEYPGLPGCGPVYAEKVLGSAPYPADGDWEPALAWPEIVKAYKKKGLTEAEAILQARMARILMDPEGATTKLWTPPTRETT